MVFINILPNVVCKNISSRYEPFNMLNLHLKKQENNEKLSIDNLLQNLLEKEKLFVIIYFTVKM